MAPPAPARTRRRRPLTQGTLLIHGLLILSVLLIGFPLYYGFVISTQSMDEVIQVPQSLIPSSHMWDNYTKIWNRLHMGQLLINTHDRGPWP